MAIYTSYFGNYRHFPKDSYLISVAHSEYCPIKVDLDIGTHYSPDKKTLFAYKNGLITEEEYTKRYIYHIMPDIGSPTMIMDLKFLLTTLSKEHENIFLLCFERPEDFCHRHILAEMLHMDIEEYPIYKK